VLRGLRQHGRRGSGAAGTLAWRATAGCCSWLPRRARRARRRPRRPALARSPGTRRQSAQRTQARHVGAPWPTRTHARTARRSRPPQLS
jgi:hypothetical protein